MQEKRRVQRTKASARVRSHTAVPGIMSEAYTAVGHLEGTPRHDLGAKLLSEGLFHPYFTWRVELEESEMMNFKRTVSTGCSDFTHFF